MMGRFQVWDREIIQTALADFYGNDMDAFGKQLEHNLTKASEGNRKSAPAGTIYLILRSIQAKKHANAITLNSRQRVLRRVPGLTMYRLGQTAKTSRLAQPS